MRVIVCVKQVVDLEQIRMNRETREPILQNLPMMVGQLEKNALAEAAKLKEKHQAEVIVLSAGSPLADEVTLECLARGADRAVTIADPALEKVSSKGIALVLAKAIEKIGSYDLILVGESSTDNGSGQVGPLIAELLKLPLAAYARQLQITVGKARVTQSFEDCFETVEVPLPAIVTITSEINEPAIPSVIDVMDASSKPQEKWQLTDIAVSQEQIKPTSIERLTNRYPEQFRKGIMLKEANLDKTLSLLVEDLKRDGVLES